MPYCEQCQASSPCVSVVGLTDAQWEATQTGWRCPQCQAKEAIEQGRFVSALNHQEAGSHYKDMPIQPVEFIHKNGIGFIEGSAIAYLCRWRVKNGIEDLRKARHFIDMLIEMETANKE